MKKLTIPPRPEGACSKASPSEGDHKKQMEEARKRSFERYEEAYRKLAEDQTMSKEDWARHMLRVCEEDPCPAGPLVAPEEVMLELYRNYVAKMRESDEKPVRWDEWHAATHANVQVTEEDK
jgi:DNA polymerase III delta prime subunit